ncbi:cache domain-containing protein [Glutamicibacter endophyticus]|uniref:cache domain-containing protein n=1 Tax=Glutamicibacter endophyticus TaxID=1522174 RepID=UPI003AF0F59D
MNQSTASAPGSNEQRAVESYFGELLEHLETLRGRLEGHLPALGEHPESEPLDELVQESIQQLRQRIRLPLSGAGFVAVEDYLADARWHMAWWQGPELARRLLVAMETAGDIYTRREWFSIPITEHRVHIAGPYVDFLCTDDFTLTFTAPVEIAGQVVGVVGFDLLVADFEEPMSRVLAQINPRATVINAHGKVLASASAQLACGARLVRGWEGENLHGHQLPNPDGTQQRVDINVLTGLPLALVTPAAGH